MKLLVTGGLGFIGSAVVRRAIGKGYKIANLDALTYAACPENLEAVKDDPNYSFFKTDICDRKALDLVFEEFKPTAIMHLAAESHVDRSIDGPGAFVQTNITGTYQLLEAARTYWIYLEKPESFIFHNV
jgi:dTDP-glucose 4,6-dehydratase